MSGYDVALQRRQVVQVVGERDQHLAALRTELGMVELVDEAVVFRVLDAQREDLRRARVQQPVLEHAAVRIARPNEMREEHKFAILGEAEGFVNNLSLGDGRRKMREEKKRKSIKRQINSSSYRFEFGQRCPAGTAH